MYNYSDIKTVHLELTEKCNAACPMCPRTINGGDENPYLHNAELSLADIKKFFPPELIQQLHQVYMCGNFGDPIVAQDCLGIYKYFRENNANLLLSMNTNGSARQKEFWQELAKIIGNNGQVIFSIDGLSDTSEIYRRNTNFEKIIQNAKAYIDAGGIAHWDFIVFAHNEHQVDEAQDFAYQLGFKKFQVKTSYRFVTYLSQNIKSIDRKNNIHAIKAPTLEKYKHNSVNAIEEKEVLVVTSKKDLLGKLRPEIFNKDINRKSDIEKVYDNATISCRVKEEKSLFISAEGIVQPCCWIAGSMYHWHFLPKGSQIWQYINKIGKDSVSAHKNSIQKIVESEYFQKTISDSWTKPSCAEGKLQVCAMTCGKETNLFTNQYI